MLTSINNDDLASAPRHNLLKVGSVTHDHPASASLLQNIIDSSTDLRLGVKSPTTVPEGSIRAVKSKFDISASAVHS
jgi:hypothetical protein